MKELDIARQHINEIDEKMAKLYQKRMELSREIADYKKKYGISVLDKARESEVVNKNLSYISDDEIAQYYTLFIKEIMKESASYQLKLNKGMKVAYTGVPGAFAYIAAKKMYPDAQYVAYPDFNSAYNEVENGNCDVAVLPIENSTAGDVGSVIDLIHSGNLYINQVMSVDIVQNLLAVKGATKDTIKTVYSHPQALAQSADYIRNHKYEQVECVNTAIAAIDVSKKKDKTIAAVASKETAELYNLEIIESNINSEKNNSTKFASFSRNLFKFDDKKNYENFIIVFSVMNEVGSLAKALNIIGSNGFNMRNLRSRPIKSMKWKYYFYAEIEGNVFSDAGNDLMIQLKTLCDEVKLVGTYTIKQ